MNPKNPKNPKLPRPQTTLEEPFNDLIGNIESKVLTLAVICGIAVNNDSINGHRGIDLINAADLLHAEILDGLNTIKKPYNTI